MKDVARWAVQTSCSLLATGGLLSAVTAPIVVLWEGHSTGNWWLTWAGGATLGTAMMCWWFIDRCARLRVEVRDLEEANLDLARENALARRSAGVAAHPAGKIPRFEGPLLRDIEHDGWRVPSLAYRWAPVGMVLVAELLDGPVTLTVKAHDCGGYPIVIES